jgi:hypothetical protein
MSYALGFDDFERYVARYLGYDASNLNTQQETDIADIINSGYRRFLNPPPINPNEPAHTWFFLHGVGTITTVADTWEYNAPADFGTLDGTLTFQEISLWRTEIQQTSENEIRRLRMQDFLEEYNYPRYFAIRWKHDTITSTAAQFIFYPTPTEVFNLDFHYEKTKAALSGTSEPLGGDVHSQTVLAAVMAAAELHMEEGGTGQWEMQFQERIRTSIDYDRRNLPRNYGYMWDKSIDRRNDWPRRVVAITHENAP